MLAVQALVLLFSVLSVVADLRDPADFDFEWDKEKGVWAREYLGENNVLGRLEMKIDNNNEAKFWLANEEKAVEPRVEGNTAYITVNTKTEKNHQIPSTGWRAGGPKETPNPADQDPSPTADASKPPLKSAMKKPGTSAQLRKGDTNPGGEMGNQEQGTPGDPPTSSKPPLRQPLKKRAKISDEITKKAPNDGGLEKSGGNEVPIGQGTGEDPNKGDNEVPIGQGTGEDPMKGDNEVPKKGGDEVPKGKGSSSGKPTPQDYQFTYDETEGVFVKEFDDLAGVKRTIKMKLTEKGEASYSIEPVPDMYKRAFFGPRSNEIWVFGPKEEKMSLSLVGWEVPPGTKTGIIPMGHVPDQYGFVKETPDMFFLTYKTTDDQKDMIEMRLSSAGDARFTFHPNRPYFPLKRENGFITIKKGPDRIAQQIPTSGWDLPRPYSRPSFKLPETNIEYNAFNVGFKKLDDDIFELSFRNPEADTETVRMRVYDDKAAEFCYTMSNNIHKSSEDGSIEYVDHDRVKHKIMPKSWSVQPPLTRTHRIGQATVAEWEKKNPKLERTGRISPETAKEWEKSKKPKLGRSGHITEESVKSWEISKAWQEKKPIEAASKAISFVSQAVVNSAPVRAVVNSAPVRFVGSALKSVGSIFKPANFNPMNWFWGRKKKAKSDVTQ